MTRPVDWGALSLTCPVCRFGLMPIESGPAGHRRRCTSCGVIVVMPRVALRNALARLTVRSSRRAIAPAGQVLGSGR
jgi:hypothetical protein